MMETWNGDVFLELPRYDDKRSSVTPPAGQSQFIIDQGCQLPAHYTQQDQRDVIRVSYPHPVSE